MDGGGVDWDLAAVVRSCCRSRPKTPASEAIGDTPSASSVSVSRGEERGEGLFSKFFPDLFTATTTSRKSEGLEDLYTHYLFNKQQPLYHQPHQQNQKQPEEVRSRSSAAAAADTTAVFVPKKHQRPASQAPRSNKRRKKQLKKVVRQVPADGVSSDMWAWRKYGQKPIKGSPYPRGYYRCSSFRGCPARKQVERNRADPGQLIITYTSDHNHPIPDRLKYPCSSSSDSASPAAVDGNPSEDKTNTRVSTDQLLSSPATSASVDGDEGEKEVEEAEAMLMVEDMEMIGDDELVFAGDADNSSLATTTTTWASPPPPFEDDDENGGFDDRPLFASPWLDNGNNSNATAAAC